VRRRAERFDGQADRFDQRAGVGSEVSREVARAVLEVVQPGSDDVVLEIGAGTGEVGRHLAAAVGYVGIDRSRAMLDRFRSRLVDAPAIVRAQLVQADAEEGWPVRETAARAVLAARVAHLLSPGHLLAEIRRVCRPGGLFLVGRVERDPDSARARLRSRRERLLRDHGLVPRGGARGTRRLLDLLTAEGATRLDPHVVASWTASTSPEQILRGWQTMTAMGGVALPAATRAAILSELRDWAAYEFTDPARVSDSTERYLLDGVRLGPPSEPAAAGALSTSDAPGESWTTRC
jgi:ubiquinone/menaquinone biosynthesis C-methylase UbiE